MIPFFVQIKCHLGKSYAVANALADAAVRLAACWLRILSLFLTYQAACRLRILSLFAARQAACWLQILSLFLA